MTKPCWYEPDLNPTYRDLAEHYGTVILPTRMRKPRDKAKAEAGVLLVQPWILAALRHQTFIELVALNRAIRELLERVRLRNPVAPDRDDFEAPLVADTNAGGDNCHRGAVLGALLGAALGYRAIPDRWICGLQIRAELSEGIESFIAQFA